MQPWQNMDGESYLAYEAMLQVERKEQEKKGKTMLFGVNSMRPQVLYRAAHVAGMALT